VFALCAYCVSACVQLPLNITWTNIPDIMDASLIIHAPTNFGANYDIQTIYDDSANHLDVTISGGPGVNATLTQVGNNFVLTILNFDGTSPSSSGASHASGTPTYLFTMAVGVIALIFRARLPTVMGVMCVYLLLAAFTTSTPMTVTAQSSCIASVTVRVPSSLRVDLSAANPVHIQCLTGQTAHPTAGCVDWISTFSRIYSSPANSGQCLDVLASSYDIFAPAGRALALSASGATYPYVAYEAPLGIPYGIAVIPFASGTANVTFWWGQEGDEDFLVLPVNVDNDAAGLHCAFAYTCVSGACVDDSGSDDSYLCAQREFLYPLGSVCNVSTCSYGAVKCTSYCSDTTGTTCNAGLCPGTYSECAANGFCLCPLHNFIGTACRPTISMVVFVVLLMTIAALL